MYSNSCSRPTNYHGEGSEVMNSIFRWAGSKRKLLKHMRGHWSPSYHRYVEPFCGSACLFFDLEPSGAVLADVNAELIAAYESIRRDVYLVIECLRRIGGGEKTYYNIRSQNPRLLSPPEAAARFIYLNHYCFNGLYRTNKAGQFNVPYGPPKSGAAIDADVLIDASKLLRNARLMNSDFADTLKYVRPGDFVYLDPPYFSSERRVFTAYSPLAFGKPDLQRLRHELDRIDALGASFLVSYEDSAEGRELLKPWAISQVETRRHIAGFASHRRGATELLATNRSIDGN